MLFVAGKCGRRAERIFSTKGDVMDTFLGSDWRELLAARGRCVSIYMPTFPGSVDELQDRVRLKNLAQRAERLIVERGLSEDEAAKLLRDVKGLPDEKPFWHDRSQGLAIFAAPGLLRMWRLPVRFDEFVYAGRRFHVKPLIPLLTDDQQYWLLAFSRNRARLFRGARFSFEERQVPGLPQSVKEAMNFIPVKGGKQVHSGAGGHLGKQSAVHHGQGGHPDAERGEMEAFLRELEGAVYPVLRESTLPLMLATVQPNVPLYRAVSRYAHVLDDVVVGSPDHLTPHALHELSWPIVAQQLELRRAKAGEEFQRLAGTPRGSQNPREVVVAAGAGRVDTLFVDRAAHLWGTLDEASQVVHAHEEEHAGDDDLLDWAAERTLEQRGTVYVVPRDRMPTDSSVAAVYRY